MTIPTFGGPVIISVSLASQETCESFRKVISREMKAMSLKYEISEKCEPL